MAIYAMKVEDFHKYYYMLTHCAIQVVQWDSELYIIHKKGDQVLSIIYEK